MNNDELGNNIETSDSLNPADKFLNIAKSISPTDRKSLVNEKLKENREAINIFISKKVPLNEIVKHFNDCFSGTFKYKITLKDLQVFISVKKKSKTKATV